LLKKALFNIRFWYNIQFSARRISTDFFVTEKKQKKETKKEGEREEKIESVQIKKFETCLRI